MVSVIVPAYNVERYIADCLESVLSQTCADWELLVVDDGSTDGTGAICDRFAARDARVRCLHQPNHGVSAARNAALELAIGEYLLFLDGDDVLSPGLIEALLARMEPDVDVTCCSCTVFSDETGLEVPRSFLSGDRDMRAMAEREPLFLQLHDGRVGQSPGRTYTAIGVPWGKLYRADLIREHELRFPPMKQFEDNLFNMYAFTLARRIVYLDAPLYRYRADHCIRAELPPEARLATIRARDEYYARYGELATPEMLQERYREKLRFLGASCKYYARHLPRREVPAAIRALCAEPAYASAIADARPYAIEPRYRFLRGLMRCGLWRAVALVSALRGN